MECIVRSPLPGDIGWLISMHGQLYAEQFNFNSEFEKDIAGKVLSFLEAGEDFNRLWIATLGGIRIGSVAVSLKRDQTAFINFLLVHPDYRGGGIGGRLMDLVIAHTSAHNLKTLHLETYSCLKDARNLYKRYGFQLSMRNEAISKYGHSFDQEFWDKRLLQTTTHDT